MEDSKFIFKIHDATKQERPLLCNLIIYALNQKEALNRAVNHVAKTSGITLSFDNGDGLQVY